MAENLSVRLGETRPSEEELGLYEDLVIYLLYHQYRDEFHEFVVRAADAKATRPKVGFYGRFQADVAHFLAVPGAGSQGRPEPTHLFACFFQVRRAFEHIYSHIVGGSMPTARLRAAVWQSIFTHDMRRYRRVLFNRMDDITTLIMGPSGTGKELVARAVGLSRYIPFDPKTESFAENFATSFHALSISALSPTLIESELFGHRRGSYTGAIEDREGYLEVCGPHGTVFLDEIGDLDPQIQVKLLRVLQTHTFQRLGDTSLRHFQGKIIAATNRNLAEEMQAGRFREDVYYRLCSDMIVTPSLHDQLQESPEELRNLIFFVAKRVAGDEAQGVAGEVEQWVEKHLGRDYRWPGNFRELEQCVRNVLVHKEYYPPPRRPKGVHEAFAEELRSGELTAEEILGRYCTLVYARTGNYEEAARRLNLDRRTVKARIDEKLLEQLRKESS